MLKRSIKYTDLNGEEAVDIVYFNLSQREIIELEVSVEGGIASLMKRIVEEKDNKELVKRFQEIILMAYGEKSEDGKSFKKSDELRAAFQDRLCYEALFMELIQEENAAAEFIEGIVPKVPVDQDKPVEPPAVSTN